MKHRLADLQLAISRREPGQFSRTDYPCKLSVPLFRVELPAHVDACAPGAFCWREYTDVAGMFHRWLHVKVPYWDWYEGRFGRVHQIAVADAPGRPHSWHWHPDHKRDFDHPWIAPSLLCWTWPPGELNGKWEEFRIEAWHGHAEGDVLKG